MKNTVPAAVLAILVFGGLYYVYVYRGGGAPSGTDTSQTTGLPTEVTPSTATNYDECIAEGNAPLSEDPDKCLTKDGHLFIKGVVEE